MKFSASFVATVAASLAATVSAIPVSSVTLPYTPRQIVPRQSYDTINEFLTGACKPYIIFFARGSTEPGNVGDSPGPQTIDGLKAALGASNVAGQGVEYPASLIDNLKPGGCDPEDAANFATLITSAATKCPSAGLFVSGYSQGAAMVHRAVEQLDATVRARIRAAVTYGDTQKQQDGSAIPNFDKSRTLIICHSGDLVCQGTLLITNAHFNYDVDAPTAVAFMVSKA